METLFQPAPEAGLTAEQVASQKKNGKQNLQPERATKTTGRILKDNICTLFNLFNVLIAAALAFAGAWSNMLFILIIALNTLIGIVQELHAKKLVDKLSLLSMPTAKVIRGGAASELPVWELVERDVIELEAGKQVCSDSVVLSGEAEVNESLLTGESDPISKSAGDRLLSGSFIISGRCRCCVEHVGAENYAAKIAREAKRLRGVHSELLASMRRVTRFTGFLIPPLGILLFLEAFFLRGDAAGHAVVTTAAGLLGMLPKGLVLLISVSLAVGIITLSKKRVLVQELYALEALAHVDTLCLDKTGTLTQGRMRVEAVYPTELCHAAPFEEWMGSFLRHSDDNNATFQALQAYFKTNVVRSPMRRIPFSSERKWSAMEFEDAGTLLMIARKGGDKNQVRSRSWLLFAVLSAVFASLTSIFGKIGVENIESNLGTAIRTVVVLAMAWVMVFASGKQREMKGISKKSWLFLFLSGITTGLSWLCYYRALQDGPASIVVPVDKLSIVVTIGFSYILLKEKLSRKAGAGLLLILLGTGVMLL